MRIAVVAAGGVGGYFGGRLADTGHAVTFVARGRHLQAIKEKGLRITSPLGDLHLAEVDATDDIASIGAVDVVLFAVKLWDTDAAAAACAPLIGPETMVVPLQNGVESRERLADALGPGPVIGGIAYISSAISEPGVIAHYSDFAKIAVGEADGAMTPRIERLAAACKGAGFGVDVPPDITVALWEKFIFMVGLSALTTATRQPIGPIRRDPQTRRLFAEVMAETAAVGRALGVGLGDDVVETRMAFCDTLPETMQASMLGDLKRGNRLEAPWLGGAVVRMAAERGFDAPVNRALYGAVRFFAEGGGGA